LWARRISSPDPSIRRAGVNIPPPEPVKARTRLFLSLLLALYLYFPPAGHKNIIHIEASRETPANGETIQAYTTPQQLRGVAADSIFGIYDFSFTTLESCEIK